MTLDVSTLDIADTKRNEHAYDTGKTTPAKRVVPRSPPDSPCLADRDFCGYPLWKAALASDAALLCRGSLGRGCRGFLRLHFLPDFLGRLVDIHVQPSLK